MDLNLIAPKKGLRANLILCPKNIFQYSHALKPEVQQALCILTR